MVRIGIIGYGWVARDYMAPAIVRHPEASLVAVVSKDDPVPETDRKVGLPHHYTDAEAMLREEELDMVYIATPNHLHRTHTELALDHGLHVLCEKPMAATLKDVEGMREAIDRSTCHYATALDQRWHPAHLRMRDLIADNDLGTITQVRLDYACWLDAGWSADNWRIDPARAGGGAIIDLAPHGLDLVEFVTGQRLKTLHILDQRAVQDYTVDDGGVLSGRLSGGAVLSHTVGYNRPETLPRRRLEVIGTGGVLLAENTMGQDPGGRLTFIGATDGKRHLLDFDHATSPFDLQLDGFLKSIDNGGRSTSGRTPGDDVRLARLFHAALPNPTPSCP